MPPRSVCLNVFTTSLGNDIGLGKERDVNMEVREVEDKMEGIESTTERGRHDSVQGSPNDSIVAAHSYSQVIANPQLSPPFTMDENKPKVPNSSAQAHAPAASSPDQSSSTSGMTPTRCSTCANGPAPGSSLSRCSRCKNVFYCSKTCQKAAWRSHKFECEPSGSLRGFSPSSAMNTPDISTPASPVAHDAALEQAIMLNLSPGDAVPVQPAETVAYRFPQHSKLWQAKYDKYRPSLQMNEITMLGAALEDAYALYAHEHGGVPSSWEVARVEYGCYLNAVGERLKLPFVLDDASKEELIHQMHRKFDALQETVESARTPLVGEEGQSELLVEFRRINEMIYGLDAEKPRSR